MDIHGELLPIVHSYPLVTTDVAMEKHHFTEKTHYKWQFSIAIFNYQRLCSWTPAILAWLKKIQAFLLGPWNWAVCSPRRDRFPGSFRWHVRAMVILPGSQAGSMGWKIRQGWMGRGSITLIRTAFIIALYSYTLFIDIHCNYILGLI